MKEEILAAVMFIIRFIEKSETFPREQLENFKTHLTALLMERYAAAPRHFPLALFVLRECMPRFVLFIRVVF